MSYETITLTLGTAVAELRLNRPDSLNSLSVAMFDEIRDALQRVSADEACRVLLVTAAGRGFCAGGDLAGMAGQMAAASQSREQTGLGSRLGKQMDEHVTPTIAALMEFPLPVVCAVNGVAAGGGFSLALACDIVIAARSARFIQSFVKIGLVPDMGNTWLLPRLIGRHRAMALSMLGQDIDAPTAQAWGMVWACVEDSELDSAARAMAHRLAEQSAPAVRLIKQAINVQDKHTFREQLEVERTLQSQAADSEYFHQSLNAFLTRRSGQS